MNTPELRARGAKALENADERVRRMRAFIGLDGFVDDIVHVVDKRESAERYTRLTQMAQWAERIRAAAGKSTNIELVSQRTKLGGNGPIMANAMASFGFQVTYLGNLGYPNLHPVFAEFARRAEVHSLAEPGYTDAVEFEDGKVMLGKHQSLKEINWANLQARFGRDRFAAALARSDFVAFVNWTMLPYMNEIWSATLREICPQLAPGGSGREGGARRWLFFDLADPEKRTDEDIRRALELIVAFEKYFDVILGLNEKESSEIGDTLGVDTRDHSPEGLLRLGAEIRRRVPVNTVVIHPTAYALALNAQGAHLVEGPFTPKPLITTGAGDHFNAGFCLGKLLGLDNELSLLLGVTTSGFYVRTGRSPALADLAGMLRQWPAAT
jgi:sugar/nucleoside kinase (ribokinase family)